MSRKPKVPAAFSALCVLFATIFCLGCSAKTPGPEEGMIVSVDLREVHRCSRISPEITVAYAPKGTKFYDVRLVEYGLRERLLGGGSWAEDGSGLIPEGALTRFYQGPCPPGTKPMNYAYVISAMESLESQPLAVRFYRFNLE